MIAKMLSTLLKSLQNCVLCTVATIAKPAPKRGLGLAWSQGELTLRIAYTTKFGRSFLFWFFLLIKDRKIGKVRWNGAVGGEPCVLVTYL